MFKTKGRHILVFNKNQCKSMKINENRKSPKTAALIFIDYQYQSINCYWFLLTIIDVIDYWFWLNGIVRKNWENWFVLLEGMKNRGLNYSVWQVKEVSFGFNYREFFKTKGSGNRDCKKYWQFRGLTKYHLPWTIYQTSLICGRVVKRRTQVCTLQSCRKNCAK